MSGNTKFLGFARNAKNAVAVGLAVFTSGVFANQASAQTLANFVNTSPASSSSTKATFTKEDVPPIVKSFLKAWLEEFIGYDVNFQYAKADDAVKDPKKSAAYTKFMKDNASDPAAQTAVEATFKRFSQFFADIQTLTKKRIFRDRFRPDVDFLGKDREDIDTDWSQRVQKENVRKLRSHIEDGGVGDTVEALCFNPNSEGVFFAINYEDTGLASRPIMTRLIQDLRARKMVVLKNTNNSPKL